MSKRVRNKTETQNECCVCIQRSTSKVHNVMSNYQKSNKNTLYDVLRKLNLINYEMSNREQEVVCESCKRNIVDFYNFKLMCENQQNNHKICIHKTEFEDPIKHFLDSNNYETLKNFIAQNPRSSAYIDDSQNQLIIRPAKSTDDQDHECFLNIHKPEIIVKTEEDVEDDEPNDSSMNEEIGVDDIGKREDSDETDDNFDEDDFDPNTTCEHEESVEEEIEVEEGVKKSVVNDIEFISRTPECLVDAMKNKGASSSKNPENWIRIKQRTARSKGEAYTSRSGKFIRAREMKPPCKTCRYKCFEKISEAERQMNFQNYWNLADFIKQKKFLFQHRTVEPVARRRARSENPRNRSYSTKYFLDTFNEDGSIKESIKVCETMFTNTLDICKNTIRTLQKKVVTGKVEDLRGQQRRKLSPGHLIALDHIKQFPYFHIEKPMPLTQMYKLYVQECCEKGAEPVKSATYRRLFSDNNECDFLRQNQKLKCTMCEEYNQATDFEKTALETNYRYHLNTTDQCRQRARWRQSGKLKAARKRQSRQQKQLMQPCDSQHQPQHFSLQEYQQPMEFM